MKIETKPTADLFKLLYDKVRITPFTQTTKKKEKVSYEDWINAKTEAMTAIQKASKLSINFLKLKNQ